MAKKMCNLYLDEDVIRELDEMAEKMGQSRSKVANTTLKTAFGGQTLMDYYKEMFGSLLRKDKATADSKEMAVM